MAENPDATLLLLDGLYRIGNLMLDDDAHDFGKFSFPGHESPFHHWQYGLILRETSSLLGHLHVATKMVETQKDMSADPFGIDAITTHFEQVAYPDP